MRVFRRLGWLACLGLLAASSAWGNGRYPAAAQLAADPSDPKRLLVQTTYGFLQTVDAGASWHWICEVAVGYEGQEDPFLAVTADGSLFAATSQGLAQSPDRGCNWQKVASPAHLGQQPAIDLVIDPAQPSHILVLATAASGVGHQLFRSEDSGKTWQATGPALPHNAYGLTADLAPSQPQRLYVSARVGENQDQHAILRSDDGGGSWTELPFAPTMLDADGKPLPADQTQVLGTYIGAVDPVQPDTLWLRVRRGLAPDQLWRSQDGGQSWQLAFQAPAGKLAGFALSPDGQTVVVGATLPHAGLWRARTDTLQFTSIGGQSASCLKWLASGLYVCADELVDSMTVGISQDGGDHFTPLHHRADLTPLECPADSRTQQLCPRLWPNVAYQLGVGESTPAPSTKPGCSAWPAPGSQAGLALLGLAAVLLRLRRA